MSASSASHKSESAPPWGRAQLFPLWNEWAPMAGEWQRWNEQVGATFGAVSREWMDFVRRRIAEDLSFQQKLVACRSPEEFWQTYAGFIETMANDYQSEFVRLSQLGGQLAGPVADEGATKQR